VVKASGTIGFAAKAGQGDFKLVDHGIIGGCVIAGNAQHLWTSGEHSSSLFLPIADLVLDPKVKHDLRECYRQIFARMRLRYLNYVQQKTHWFPFKLEMHRYRDKSLLVGRGPSICSEVEGAVVFLQLCKSDTAADSCHCSNYLQDPGDALTRIDKDYPHIPRDCKPGRYVIIRATGLHQRVEGWILDNTQGPNVLGNPTDNLRPASNDQQLTQCLLGHSPRFSPCMLNVQIRHLPFSCSRKCCSYQARRQLPSFSDTSHIICALRTVGTRINILPPTFLGVFPKITGRFCICFV
jgi:hypothetical protein